MDRQRFSFAWSGLLGFDIFISYRRSDGSAYAEKLWRDLKAAGITPFLDRAETPGGAQLTPSLVRALRRSKMLLILLTPQVLDSEWVQQEVETFSKFRGRAIVPINIDDFIARHKLDGTRLARLKDYSWIEETREGLETGVPSETVLAEIDKGFRKVRVRAISRSIVAIVMLVLAATAVTSLVQMRRAQREAEISLAAQIAAQAELIRTQDDSQSDLAATLALDSFQRYPSPQAEQTLRAALESLPIQLASFQVEQATDIAFAPDGSGILTYDSKSRKSKLYALSGKLIRGFACARPEICDVGLQAGTAAAASPDEGGGATIRIVELASGRQRWSFHWENVPTIMAFDASAQTIGAINAEGNACVWKMQALERPVCMKGPPGAMWKLNANGKLLASRHEDEDDDEKVTTQVWDTQTGAEVLKTGGWVGMSQTGKYTVVTSGNTQAHVRNLEKQTDLPDFQHEDTISGAVFDATDQLMATSSSAYRLRFWLLVSERPEAAIVTTVAPAHRRLLDFTADGLGVMTEADNPRGGTDLLIWRLRSRDRLLDLVPKQRIHHQGNIYAVATHADGFTYATLDDKDTVRVWNTSDGNMVSIVRHEHEVENPKPVQACRQAGSSWADRLHRLIPERKPAAGGPDLRGADAVDPCGRYFATTSKVSGGRDRQIVFVYRTATHQEVVRIAHSANVNSVVFSADGRYVLTGGADHAIKIWDLDEQRQTTSFEMETEVRSVQFSDDGRQIIAVGDKDAFERFPVATYIWKTEDLIRAIARREMRRLTRDEWARYLGSRMPLQTAR